MSVAVTLPALAEARAQPVKNGFYSSLAGVRSSDVEFHVRSGETIPTLSLGCLPADPSLTQSTSYAGIAVIAPKLPIRITLPEIRIWLALWWIAHSRVSINLTAADTW